MLRALLHFLINGLSVFLSGYLLPGVYIENYWVALLSAFVLGLLNVLVKPLLVILSLPITLLTFGLFTLVIDTVVILLTARLVSGFRIDDFGSGFLFVLVLAVMSFTFNSLLEAEKKAEK